MNLIIKKELLNEFCKLNNFIIVTNEMLKGKSCEEDVVKRFVEWAGDDILVAHNAKFDLSFMYMAYLKYSLGRFNFDVIEDNSPVLERLEEIDPLKTTPMEAINLLYELKELSKK